MPLLVAVYVLVYFLLPFRTCAYPGLFTDDFFYYLVAARNIVAGHGSTFDGTHLTNGYHPLWMVVCIAMTAIFHGKALFVAFALLASGLVLWFYHSTYQCLRPFTTVFAAQCIAAALALDLADISAGMEITLSVPLLAFLCRYRLRDFKWSPRQAFLYGLLAAATILARLDCALFVVLLGILDMSLSSDVSWSVRRRAVAPFVAGMLPVVAYLLFNLHVFGTAMPISSHAKQLRFHHSFTPLPVHSLLHFPLPERNALIGPVLLGLCISVVLLLVFGSRRLPRGARGVVWALLLFMPAQLAVLSFNSDWPIWPWYMHSLLACGLGAAIVILTRDEKFFLRRYHLSGTFAALLCGYVAFFIYHYDLRGRTELGFGRYSIFLAAQDLEQFAASHPGVYAMGDRAGTVGYYLPDPLVQTEGLMMDKAFLENIQTQRNLLDVLRQYHVRYFVATNPTPQGPCLLVKEPTQGGRDIPRMEGVFCSTPVHTYKNTDSKYRNVVFDMSLEKF